MTPKIEKAVTRALDYLAREQRRQGYWEANNGQYKVAMTALAGTALLCEGSTTTRGKYASNISLAVDYLLDMSQPNGLIGYKEDYRYTYGHGFSMVFLSQVFGEEEDAERRADIHRVLTKAVEFCGYAQTSRRRLGLRLRQRRQRLRRRLHLHHAGPGPARLPQRRHRRAQGDHRPGQTVHRRLHDA